MAPAARGAGKVGNKTCFSIPKAWSLQHFESSNCWETVLVLYISLALSTSYQTRSSPWDNKTIFRDSQKGKSDGEILIGAARIHPLG